jgi:hypothetical protein
MIGIVGVVMFPTIRMSWERQQLKMAEDAVYETLDSEYALLDSAKDVESARAAAPRYGELRTRLRKTLEALKAVRADSTLPETERIDREIAFKRRLSELISEREKQGVFRRNRATRIELSSATNAETEVFISRLFVDLFLSNQVRQQQREDEKNRTVTRSEDSLKGASPTNSTSATGMPQRQTPSKAQSPNPPQSGFGLPGEAFENPKN